MITAQELDTLLKAIPPKPEILEQTLLQVQAGDLTKAAIIASEDLALTSYLKNFVNQPNFYFQKEIKEVKQIFGILGVNTAKELLYHYMLHLFSPKQWELFNLNEKSFAEFQSTLSANWKKVLDALKIPASDITAIVSLVPASIIVTEMLFASHQKEVQILREVKNLDYSTILERMTGMTLFDVATIIAQTWEMNSKAIKLLNLSAGTIPCDDSTMCNLSRYLHLLFFHTLSQPTFIEAGLNDFLDFNPEYVMPIMENFQELVNS